jgi:holo-ACP synthase
METRLENLMLRIMTAKEKRAARQQRLLRVYKTPVVSLTLNLPGGFDSYILWKQVWQSGITALEQHFPERKHISSRCGLWGPETFLATEMDPGSIKRITFTIEEEHPLGRLFDLDVIDLDGRPFSRTLLGIKPRTCLICDKAAAVCYVSRTHSLDELHREVNRIIAEGMRIT